MSNIDDIDSCHGLCNCLFHDHVVCNSYHHGHGHLCHNSYYYNYHGRDSIVCSCFGIGLPNYFVTPSPLLRPSIWLSTAILAPVGSVASIVTSIIIIVVVIVYIFILFFLFRGRQRWWRLLLWLRFTFTFLSSVTSCSFKWFG